MRDLAHELRQRAPAQALPDAEFLLAQRSGLRARRRVVEHQPGKGLGHEQVSWVSLRARGAWPPSLNRMLEIGLTPRCRSADNLRVTPLRTNPRHRMNTV